MSAQLRGLQERLRGLLESGNTYEAQELAITVCTRLSKTGKEAEGREVLVHACKAVLAKGDAGAGAALAGFLVEHLKRNKVNLDAAAVLDQLRDVARAFGKDKALDMFLEGVAKLARSSGSAGLRKTVVQLYLDSGRFGKAYLNVLRLDDADIVTKVLVDWALDKETKNEERDLIICRGIFELLALGKLEVAEKCYVRSANAWRGKIGKSTPLLNCAAFVLNVLKMEDGERMLLELRARYQESLDRDPIFDVFLAHCQKRYFGAGGGGGGLMDVLSGFLGTSSEYDLGGSQSSSSEEEEADPYQGYSMLQEEGDEAAFVGVGELEEEEKGPGEVADLEAAVERLDSQAGRDPTVAMYSKFLPRGLGSCEHVLAKPVCGEHEGLQGFNFDQVDYAQVQLVMRSVHISKTTNTK